MRHTNLFSRLSLAFALSLSAASLVAVAADATDTTEIEVTANGKTEKIAIADLKLGETRQLYSEAGTLVTVTRLADSLELDIGGDKTSVPMVEAGTLDDAELEALIADEGGITVDGKTRVIRIHHGDAAHDGKQRRVVMIGGKAEPHVVVKHGGGADDGKQVIVKRKVTKADES